MKHKINKKLLLNEKGFSWHTRYSSNENTDDMGRWARIGYYNGFCIAWISGHISQEEYPNLDNKRTGKYNLFIATLNFPISSQQLSGIEKFDNIDDAKKYTEEMFLDFKELISDDLYCPVCGYNEEEE